MTNKNISRRQSLLFLPALFLTACETSQRAVRNFCYDNQMPQPLLSLCEQTVGSEGFTAPDTNAVYYKPAFPQRAAKETVLANQLHASGYELGNPIFIRIFKETSVLEIWMLENSGDQFSLIRRYEICAYSGDLGPKFYEGDKQSPEGFYTLSLPNMRASQDYHLFMELDFPNTRDRAWGRTGSWIGIHGGCTSIGCFAMTDEFIEDIYLLTEASLMSSQTTVPVHSFPFTMTQDRIEREKANLHYDFWRQLQPAYTTVEKTGFPPVISMLGKNYLIKPVAGLEAYKSTQY